MGANAQGNFGRELNRIQERWVITRLTNVRSRGFSISASRAIARSRNRFALPRRNSEGTFLSEWFSLLTQRLILMPQNYSDQSHDRKYFSTIHETERLARRLHVGNS
jgi:hypothetical protein